MEFTRNENNQLVNETPEGQSNNKLINYGFSCGTNNAHKLNTADVLRLHTSTQPINSVTGEEVGEPSCNTVSDVHVPIAEFFQYFGITPEKWAAFFCDKWDASQVAPETEGGEA